LPRALRIAKAEGLIVTRFEIDPATGKIIVVVGTTVVAQGPIIKARALDVADGFVGLFHLQGAFDRATSATVPIGEPQAAQSFAHGASNNQG